MNSILRFLPLTALTILIFSCGSKEGVEQKKEKLAELKDQISNLTNEIKALESEISTLDPGYAKANKKSI